MKLYSAILTIALFCQAFSLSAYGTPTVDNPSTQDYANLTPQEKEELKKVMIKVKQATYPGIPVVLCSGCCAFLASPLIVSNCIARGLIAGITVGMIMNYYTEKEVQKAKKEWFENHKKITNLKDKI